MSVAVISYDRGISDPAASLTAEAGIAVFKIAFERWINETSQPDLPQLTRESLEELKAALRVSAPLVR